MGGGQFDLPPPRPNRVKIGRKLPHVSERFIVGIYQYKAGGGQMQYIFVQFQVCCRCEALFEKLKLNGLNCKMSKAMKCIIELVRRNQRPRCNALKLTQSWISMQPYLHTINSPLYHFFYYSRELKGLDSNFPILLPVHTNDGDLRYFQLRFLFKYQIV